MTPVARLRRIAETIGVVRDAAVGGTGYLDGPVHMIERAAKGVDKFGRVFITLCVQSTGRDDHRTYSNAGIVTIFQRWSDGEDIVTQADNTRRGAPSLIRTHATDADMTLLEELVASGYAERTIPEVAGGTLHERLTLFDPEPLVAEARRAVRELDDQAGVVG
jgi:hypothetical protein